jgi:hypothetical protein
MKTIVIPTSLLLVIAVHAGAVERDPASVLELVSPVSVVYVGGCPDGGSTKGMLADARGTNYCFFIDRRLQTKTYGRWYVGGDIDTGKAELLPEDDRRIGAIKSILVAWVNRVVPADEQERLGKLDRPPAPGKDLSSEAKLLEYAKWFIIRHFKNAKD